MRINALNEMKTRPAAKPKAVKPKRRLRADTCLCRVCKQIKPVNRGNWQADPRNVDNGGFRLHKCRNCINADLKRRRAELAERACRIREQYEQRKLELRAQKSELEIERADAREAERVKRAAERMTIEYSCFDKWKRNRTRSCSAVYIEHDIGVFRDMLARQAGRCSLTGDELTAENVSIDHIVPVSRGGGHEVSNLRLVTKQVNAMRMDRSDADFIELCRKVVRTFT
jgi:hypothetical protein